MHETQASSSFLTILLFLRPAINDAAETQNNAQRQQNMIIENARLGKGFRTILAQNTH